MAQIKVSRSERPPERRNRSRFGMVFLLVVVVLNALAILLAWQDGSWGALGIAMAYGPMMNGLLALAALIAIPLVMQPFSIWRYLALSIAVPATAIWIDAAIIFRMDLHGH